MFMCGNSQQIHPRPSIPIHKVFNNDENVFYERRAHKNSIPIYTLDNEGDGMCFGIANAIDWESWDLFIKGFIVSKTMVKEDDCFYPRLLGYREGFLVVKSVTSNKVICVKGIKSCIRIGGLKVYLDTSEYGEICLNFKNIEHVRAFCSVISGFISELYSTNLD